jgi:hypothetical protein
MCFKQYGGALPAITNHTHSKQKADESKADKSNVKQKRDGSSLEESSKTKAAASKVDKRSKRTKARLATTTQTKIVFKKTHAGLNHPILPVDSGHPVSLLLPRPTQPHHPKRSHPHIFKKYENMKRLCKTKILPTCTRPAANHGPQQANKRINGG